jgi:hypothetical protein
MIDRVERLAKEGPISSSDGPFEVIFGESAVLASI